MASARRNCRPSATISIRGNLAHRIADFSEHNGGLIRYDDLKALPRRDRHARAPPPTAASKSISRASGRKAR